MEGSHLVVGAIVSAALVSVVLWSLIAPPSAPEPVYHGKTLTKWLDEMVYTPMSSVPPKVGRSDPLQTIQIALRGMGTNALPRLLGMVRARDSRLTAGLIQLLRRQTVIPVRLSAKEQHFRAVLAFQLLGRTASPVEGELMELALHDPDAAVRQAAGDALFFVEPNGDIGSGPF